MEWRNKFENDKQREGRTGRDKTEKRSGKHVILASVARGKRKTEDGEQQEK